MSGKAARTTGINHATLLIKVAALGGESVVLVPLEAGRERNEQASA